MVTMSRIKNQEPKQKIFALLAKNKEYEQRYMKEATKLTDPTLIKYLKHLEAKQIIEYREEPSTKGGKEKKIFTLTRKGVVLALMDAKTIKEVETIASNHPDKLLTLKKWSLFKQAGIETLVYTSLKESLKLLRALDNNYRRDGFKMTWANEQIFMGSIDSSILFILFEHYPEIAPSATKFMMPTFKQDSDLSNFINQCFVKEEERYRKLQVAKKAWDTT
jgi:DNA-binding PadR family transcriptional regulator